MTGQEQRPTKGFVRQSATSSAAALVALLSGLLLDVALAVRFGAGRKSDAFFATARIPIGLTALVTSVASVAWVPLFTRERRERGHGSMTQFASRMLSAVTIAGVVLCGLATLLARPLINVTAPGLSASQLHLAASMVAPMFLVVPLVAAAEAVRAAMNASYSFVLPAAMNLFMNGLAASLVFLNHGHDIHAVAWAYVAGAAFQLVVITAIAWAQGVHIGLSWRINDPRVRAATTLSARPTVSSLLNLGNRLVEQGLASFLPAGSITILSYSQRLISAVGGGIFFRPITVALLPRLADAEHAGDRRAVGSLVRRGLRVAIAVSLPLTVFTIALAGPTIRLVFHRGNFGPHATHLLALTLAVYGASLIGSGVQRVMLAPFYARLDTRTPLRNTVYGVIVDLVLLVPCVLIFGLHSSNGLIGVAIAYSITQYFIVAHAWLRLRETVPLKLRALRGYLLRSLIASGASIAVMTLLVAALHLTTVHGRVQLLVLTSVTALAGMVTLLVSAGLMIGPSNRLLMVRSFTWDDQRRRHIGRHRMLSLTAQTTTPQKSVPRSK